jgi:hypothetical protein
MMTSEQIDRIGKFLINEIRDFYIDKFDGLVNGQDPFANHKLRKEIINRFSEEDLIFIKKLIIYCTDNTLSDLLWNLDKSNNESDITICVDDKVLSKDDPCLQSLLYSDEGWIARFSRHYHEDDV